jgi:hypothetical protein
MASAYMPNATTAVMKTNHNATTAIAAAYLLRPP